VLNGIYLTTLKLGQTTESEEAFGRLVAYGIAHNQLGVKFLFNPGTIDFWSDPKVTSAYRMWLRQIARQANAAGVCMDIVGHSSNTGPEGVNDSLSLRRAQYIKQRLATDSTDSERWRARGLGSRQNLVGSGTDDVVDALDRRVEFAIVECGR
jgi:outer membrane protein OmpA-like peptidoglycan-associated protein